jgi:hypothetical protein
MLQFHSSFYFQEFKGRKWMHLPMSDSAAPVIGGLVAGIGFIVVVAFGGQLEFIRTLWSVHFAFMIVIKSLFL